MRAGPKLEQSLLKQSIAAAIGSAVVAFVLGILLRSQVILFDGLYSLISVILSLSTYAAVRFMHKADWERFPFGKYAIEPLVVIVKYLAVIALVIASLIAAVIALLTGGRDILLGPGLAYALFAVIFCFSIYRHLAQRNRGLNSALVQTEVNEWYLDMIVSVGVLMGFAIGWAMSWQEDLAPYVVYVDPVLMILVSVYFLRWPLVSIRDSVREVLDMKPEGGLADDIERVVEELRKEYRMQEAFVRVSKVARTLWLEIDFVVGPAGRITSIEQQDRMREEIMHRIPRAGLEVWLTVAFTNDRRWAVE